MRLKNVMSRHVTCVRPGDRLEKASKRMGLNGIHHLVVMDRGKVRGLLTEAYIADTNRRGRRESGGRDGSPYRGRHTRNVYQPGGADDAWTSRGALVVVDGKGLAGIVTISDLLDVLGGRTKRRRSGVAR